MKTERNLSLFDLRSQSCTHCWCAAGHMAETRSAETNCSTLSCCCLQRNREFLLEKQTVMVLLSWAILDGYLYLCHITGRKIQQFFLFITTLISKMYFFCSMTAMMTATPILLTAAKSIWSLRPEHTTHVLLESDTNYNKIIVVS